MALKTEKMQWVATCIKTEMGREMIILYWFISNNEPIHKAIHMQQRMITNVYVNLINQTIDVVTHNKNPKRNGIKPNI